MAIVFKAKIKNLDGPSAVEKAGKGEGSRGGTIIGHTKSGKPVYANRSAGHASYSDFTHIDHDDALELHMSRGLYHKNQSFSAIRNKNSAAEMKHTRKAKKHRSIAVGHKDLAREPRPWFRSAGEPRPWFR